MPTTTNLSSTSEDLLRLSITGNGLRLQSATPPLSPQGGDLWPQSTSGRAFFYDATRSKWLSSEMIALPFGRTGNTTSGTFYLSAGGAVYTTAAQGEVMPDNATIVGFSCSRSNILASSFRLFRNATTLLDIATGAAMSGSTNTLNLDVSQNERITVQNLGPSTVANAIGLVFVRWRA